MKKTYALAAGMSSFAFAVAALTVSPVIAEETGTQVYTQEQLDEKARLKAESAAQREALLKQKAEAARLKAEQKVQQARESAKQKLESARKTSCEKNEAKINGILQRAAQHGEKQLGVFQKIEDRVKEFKDTKQITVENYEAVVAAVEEKEAAAVAAIEATQATTFECDSESTDKSFSGLVRDTVKSQRAALHDYRKSINELIHAVKKGVKAENGDTNQQESQEQ